MKAPRGAGWEHFARRSRIYILGLPDERDREKFPFVYRGIGIEREGGKPFG